MKKTAKSTFILFLVVSFFSKAQFFRTKIDYKAGSGTSGIAIADLNGDARLDIVATNSFKNTISVFINTGKGKFGPKVDYSTGSDPRSVVIGDITGDGKADLVVANYFGGTLSVFSNTGIGSFSSLGIIDTPGTITGGLAIGDLNNDSQLDLAVANWSDNTVSTYFNTGNGQFGSKVDYAAGYSPSSVAIGDLNKDGKPDLLISNYANNTITQYNNNGNSVFGDRVDFDIIDFFKYPMSVVIGDVTDDGKADWAVAKLSGTISVYTSTGSGFGPNVDYQTGGTLCLAIGDLNNDGKLDLVNTNCINNNLTVFTNTNNGRFDSKLDLSTGKFPIGVALGDLNNDGKLDLAVANSTDSTISVILNMGCSPWIEKISSTFSSEGKTITLTGGNLLNVTTVQFASGASASFNNIDISKLVVIVPKGAGTGPITVSGMCGESESPNFTFIKSTQTILGFNLPSTVELINGNISLNGNASSGLALSYTSSNSSIASISGNTFIPLSAGNVTITANQLGDADYYSAIKVIQIVSIIGITFNTGLVAYYPFNGNANDESGNGNHGTVVGASLINDRFGNINTAYSFNGINNTITFSGVPTKATDNWSISAWVNPSSLNQASMVISLGYDNNATKADGYAFGMGEGSFGNFNLGSNLMVLYSLIGFYNTNYQLLQNTWYNVIMQRSSGILKVYVNGSLLGISLNSSPIEPSEFRIGSQHGIRFFNGKIDDIRIYNRALNEAEIKALYKECSSISAPSIALTSNKLNSTSLAGFNYQWYLNESTISGANSNVLNDPLQIGVYKVKAKTGSCEAISLPFNIGSFPTPTTISGTQVITVVSYKIIVKDENGNTITGMVQRKENQNVSIYPNPSKGVFRIESNLVPIEKIEIFNLQGTKVYDTKDKEINIKGMPNGNYLIKIFDPDAKLIETRKMIIE